MSPAPPQVPLGSARLLPSVLQNSEEACSASASNGLQNMPVYACRSYTIGPPFLLQAVLHS